MQSRIKNLIFAAAFACLLALPLSAYANAGGSLLSVMQDGDCTHDDRITVCDSTVEYRTEGYSHIECAFCGEILDEIIIPAPGMSDDRELVESTIEYGGISINGAGGGMRTMYSANRENVSAIEDIGYTVEYGFAASAGYDITPALNDGCDGFSTGAGVLSTPVYKTETGVLSSLEQTESIHKFAAVIVNIPAAKINYSQTILLYTYFVVRDTDGMVVTLELVGPPAADESELVELDGDGFSYMGIPLSGADNMEKHSYYGRTYKYVAAMLLEANEQSRALSEEMQGICRRIICTGEDVSEEDIRIRSDFFVYDKNSAVDSVRTGRKNIHTYSGMLNLSSWQNQSITFSCDSADALYSKVCAENLPLEVRGCDRCGYKGRTVTFDEAFSETYDKIEILGVDDESASIIFANADGDEIICDDINLTVFEYNDTMNLNRDVPPMYDYKQAYLEVKVGFLQANREYKNALIANELSTLEITYFPTAYLFYYSGIDRSDRIMNGDFVNITAPENGVFDERLFMYQQYFVPRIATAGYTTSERRNVTADFTLYGKYDNESGSLDGVLIKLVTEKNADDTLKYEDGGWSPWI